MSQPSRVPHHSGRQGHGHTPRARSPESYYANNPNQSTRRTSSPIGWSAPSNAATHGSAHGSMHGSVHGSGAYPQGGRSPQWSGVYRSDSTYSNAPRQHGNATPSILQDECRAWFIAIDQDGDGSLSSEELRNALLNNGGLRFSLSTVKYLMSIFDSDGNGVITYEEFEPLWLYMINWRQMFDSFDADRDGRIDAAELGRALEHYNLRVGPLVLDKLVKKYGVVPSRNRVPGYGQPHGQPRPQMELDQFVCASVVVRQMCDLYEGAREGDDHI
ncbi:hypothetical protein BGY98DRAFT_1099461 [Russula aff. rugulosa BPL654]|nr:hypothetical protein BGY98DRAFT_1099461 [Russula aff. rugulosa BPL654]